MHNYAQLKWIKGSLLTEMLVLFSGRTQSGLNHCLYSLSVR